MKFFFCVLFAGIALATSGEFAFKLLFAITGVVAFITVALLIYVLLDGAKQAISLYRDIGKQ